MHFEFPLGQPFSSCSSGRSPCPCNNPFDFSYHMQYTSNHIVANGKSIDREHGFITVVAGTKSECSCTDCSSFQPATKSACQLSPTWISSFMELDFIGIFTHSQHNMQIVREKIYFLFLNF